MSTLPALFPELIWLQVDKIKAEMWLQENVKGTPIFHHGALNTYTGRMKEGVQIFLDR